MSEHGCGMSDFIGRVEVIPHDGAVVARIVGEVDISNVRDIERALIDATHQNATGHLVDLSETTYLDSSGVRMLFALAERLRTRRQQLVVVAPGAGIVSRVLELTDARAVFPVVSRIEDAGVQPV